MFEGVFTALVTPFKNGKIDYDSVAAIIEHQIAGGVDGVVPMGTTGESPTVSYEEHEEFIVRVVTLVNKRIKVIAGTGSNSTDEAIYLSKAAQDAGVDGVLLVNPYYNKPPQRGLIAHFESVAQSINIPVILYNIPGRTGINFLPESVAQLIQRVPNIVAMKEASGDINQMMNLVEMCGNSITLLSGDDNLLLPVLAIGGKGIISVISNLLPNDVKAVVTNYNNGNLEEAKRLFYKLLPLCRAMFYETNPIPIKAAMAMAGFCSSEMRLPLVPLSADNHERLKKALLAYGVKL
ncbi:MAG TPA: 4-hydroxy-tetrahydrodipicolinate synthase [Spirochaetota bacterium]|nr:4-hydroxy-tetrahydrodipicolinate synthase [Spirochaetota bacterium]